MDLVCGPYVGSGFFLSCVLCGSKDFSCLLPFSGRNCRANILAPSSSGYPVWSKLLLPGIVGGSSGIFACVILVSLLMWTFDAIEGIL